MLIKLDYRENKLIQLCSAYIEDSQDIKVVSENLPLGDAIICDNEGNEKIIIERKSLNDLASSIRDGRYKEQSYRLNQCDMHNHRIYYLVEGDFRYYRPFKGMPDKKTLLSAMVSISYFKGFSLYRTTSLQETAEWIVQFASKLIKEGPIAIPYYNGGAELIESTTNYSQVVGKRVKRDNITTENIGEIMLSQIPSVSNVSAKSIMEHFKTFSNLVKSLENDSSCLNDVNVVNKNGKTVHLTKPCINNIYNFLVKPSIINIETI